MIENYAAAVVSLLQSGQAPDMVLENLKKTLESKNLSKHYGKIVVVAGRMLQNVGSKTKPKVTLAAVADQKTYENQITTRLSAVGSGDTDPDVVIDPNIIGGFTVSTTDTEFDASYKTALLTLYRNSVT